jgi:hypothetical protein
VGRWSLEVVLRGCCCFCWGIVALKRKGSYWNVMMMLMVVLVGVV